MSSGKKKNKNKNLNQKQSEKSRRDSEIKEYGKLVSLRPSVVMKSKKDYRRKWNLKDYIDEGKESI